MAKLGESGVAIYLVTGGCGFIGSHLADALLADGHQVHILDNLSTGDRINCPASANLVVGDIRDRETVAALMRAVDGCFHLAAIASVTQTLADWPGTSQINLAGTVNILDKARRGRGGGPVPVVYASSAAVDGNNQRLPISEADCPAPLTPYGADKAACELHGLVARESFGVSAVGLRFFNVFGPRQNPASPYSGVISIFADRFRRGVACELFGDGHQGRDFVYVADVVAALKESMASATVARPVYNVCTGNLTTLNDLLDILTELFGDQPPVHRRPARPGDIHLSVGDPAALAADLGVRARTTLRDGLRNLLAEDIRVAA